MVNQGDILTPLGTFYHHQRRHRRQYRYHVNQTRLWMDAVFVHLDFNLLTARMLAVIGCAGGSAGDGGMPEAAES